MACSGVKSACGCISGAMSFIVALTSALLALLSSAILFSGIIMLLGTNLFQVESANYSVWLIIGLATYQIFLAFLGILGATFGCRNILKLFALLAALNVLSLFFVAAYVGPRLDNGAQQIIDQLETSQKKFDWTSKPSDCRQAKSPWAVTQSYLQCCGLLSYEDWGTSETIDAKKQPVYPASCCPEQNATRIDGRYLCLNNDSLYKTPCSDSIKAISAGTTSLVNTLVWMNLILSMMANIIIHCRLRTEKHSEQRCILSP